MAEVTAEICTSLETLINSQNTHDELECREYLKYAEEFLFKRDTLKECLYSERETPTNMGVTDYVISGTIGNNPYLDPVCVKTYVWEFKAPQCFIFKKDTENRLVPTKELFSAENQLLNYYHSLKYDLTLCQRFRTYPKDVFIGGIIIGSKDKLVQGNFDTEKKKRLLKDAFDIRSMYFYKETGLVLKTWSDILDYLTNKYVKLTKDSVVPDYTFEDYRIQEGTISVEETINTTN